MLKLHRLKISGFKSFVDPVEVSFAGGITAIVGPNGCGKSNLSDAITWVLGEQSAKSLRGAKMEDVIFSGSSSRKPVGMAEVSLELLADPSFEAAQNGKIEIGRRVFRSGESHYQLNGKRVRLKQIKDLLMDTGLGIRAYSVIEQGKIGMILSGKPQERRKLLEEAAGITRYKARKRIAEVKLEEALANLLRLDDIVSEVERALRSLKRQANAARRFQEREREHRKLLRQVLFGRWALLAERLSELESGLAMETDRDAELAAGLHQNEAGMAEGREHLDELAAELAAKHQRQAELAATIEGRQEFIKGSRQRLVEIQERLVRGREQAGERGEQTDLLGSSLGNLDQRTVELIAERDEAARLVAEDEARIAQAQDNVKSHEARLEGLRQELLGCMAQLNQMRAELQHEQVEIEKRAFRRRYLDEERVRLDSQLAEAEATLQAIEERVTAAEKHLAESTDKRQDLSTRLDSVLQQESRLSGERRQLEDALAGMRQRRSILIELSEEHAQRRRSLVDKLGQIGLAEPRFLADDLRSVDGWERGIDHFLGELADAVVLGPDDDPLALARALSELAGSGIFLRPLAGREASGKIDDPALHASLAEALKLPPELGRALPPAYLVADAADAQRLAAEHPGIAFISRDRLWSLAGTLRVQSEKAAPGVLARESELQELSQAIPEHEQRLLAAAETLERLVAERTAHAADINRVDEEIAGLRREIAVGQARRQDSAARREKIAGERETVVTEQQEIDRELGVASEHKERLSDRVAETESQHQELGTKLDQAQAEVEAAREERESLRTSGAGRRGRLELLEERFEAHHQEAIRIRRQIEESQRQARQWTDEEEALQQRMRELELATEQAEEELQIALQQRSSSQEEVIAAQQVLDQRREEVRELENQVRASREQRESMRGHIEQLKVSQATVRQEAEHETQRYLEAFKRPLPGTAPEPTDAVAEEDALAEEEADLEEGHIEESELIAAAVDDPHAAPTEDADSQAEASDEDTEDVDVATRAAREAAAREFEAREVEEESQLERLEPEHLSELETELARLKELLERMGPVNVLAAEEYDEQQERHAFLVVQRKDIAESVDSLKRTISEINETSSIRFLDTFNAVNQTFGKTFQRLFRGGEAYMGLLDESDPLDSGIEITARPPGKRPQNIMLLSGGEKALTAIALLFALFQAKPSPFCILDEVDAPLDDSNVLRFVDTLGEMAEGTQFIVITHNKLTMEVAGTLYGVTMEERGISKLVSVEIEEVQPTPQAATA